MALDGGEPAPCLVGGTGRSGTTVLGALIGRHRSYGLVRVEAKFHAMMKTARNMQRPATLPDLLLEFVSVEEFVAALRGHWFLWTTSWGARRGIRGLVNRPQLRAIAAAFARDYAADRWAASGALLEAVFAKVRPEGGSWVEMTPHNMAAAHLLSRCLPAARFVHIVRDGRDVASSIVTRHWGPNDWDAALRDWSLRLERALAGTSQVEPSRVLVLHMEDLITLSRDATYRRLLDFLRLDDDPGMREFFDVKMDGSKAHVGRWREGLPAQEVDRRDDLYRAALADLSRRVGGQVVASLCARLLTPR